MSARACQLLILGALLSGCGTPAMGEPPAFLTLTRRDAEPSGANCAHGGTAVRSGLDTNRSGILEDSEVAHTDYVCHGPVLVRMDPIEGGECPEFGTAVRTGVDRNGNGVLDDDEIEQTTAVCDTIGLWKGDFLAADWADSRKLAELMMARVVVGNLEIAAGSPVNLIELELVTGNLHVHAGSDFVKLPSLSEVDGDATIEVAGDGATSLPLLEHLGGDLVIDGPGAGADAIAAPLLTVLRGSLLFGAGLRGAVSVPAVKSVGGNIETVQGTGVTGISLSGLQEIVGSLAISGNALTALSIPLEHTIGRGLFLESCPVLTDVELGTTSIEGPMEITGAPALTTLAMPNLVRAREAVSLVDIVVQDVGLVALEFPALQDTNGIIIRNSNALTAVRLPRLETTTDPDLGTETMLRFEDNPALESVSAPEVTGLESLFLGSEGPKIVEGRIRELDFAKLTTVRSLMMIGGAKLPDLSGFPNLQDVTSLFLQDIDLLPDLRSLASLRHVAELALTRMSAMTSLSGLEGMTSLGGGLFLIEDDALTDLAPLHDLVQVGILSLKSDHALADCSLPNLTRITSILAITDMSALEDLSGFAAVQSVGGDILFDQDPGLSDDEIADFEHRIGR